MDMRRIYSARNLIEAQAIKDFLDDKGIKSGYSEAVSGLQFGIYDIPIYVSESDYSEKLLQEIHSFVKPSEPAEAKTAEAIKGIWSPLSAIAIYLFFALPGGYAIGFASHLSDYFFRPARAFGELSILGYFILLKRQRIVDYLNLKPISLTRCVSWVALYVFWYFAANRIFNITHLPHTHHFKQALERAPFPAVFGAVLIAPILEESVFRGFVFKSFELKNTLVGITVTSLLWTMSHFTSGSNIFELGELFLGGLFLGIGRAKTGSLYAPLLMHLAFNTTSVLHNYLHYFS